MTAHWEQEMGLDPLQEGGADQGNNPPSPEQRIQLLGYFVKPRLQHHNVNNILTASSHSCVLHVPWLTSSLRSPTTTGPLPGSS